ncbi:MAG: pilus assembly PilX N-terminal domain-containing protein [Syntrophobacterales bacterium]|nr:MAG: pilus assembly PilX N-terminal domain-containing protein [Syntrophobacterales bacterium]
MRNEKGVVLVIAVLAMITVTILGIAAMMTSDIEVRMSGNQRCMDTALYAADGGIDNGLSWLAGSGAAKPDEINLPTIEETRDIPDPENEEIYSEYYISDLHHDTNPPMGWDVTDFRRYYYQIYSQGAGPNGSSAEVEVIASIVYPLQEY